METFDVDYGRRQQLIPWVRLHLVVCISQDSYPSYAAPLNHLRLGYQDMETSLDPTTIRYQAAVGKQQLLRPLLRRL